MSVITVSQHIDASPEVVFRRATDLSHWPDIIKGIDRVELLTDGPFGLGTRFKETRTMFGKEASEEMEVVKYDPPHGYAVVAESHGAHYDTTFHFEPDEGGTLVTFHFDAKALTLAAKVMGVLFMPLMKRSIVKCVKEDLQDIKTASESENE